MTIDIITLTEEQYEKLSEEQIVTVQEAQLKKNRLSWSLEKKKLDEKHRLIGQGIFLSGIWEAYCASLQSEYEQEVESIRTGLAFYLQYTMRPTGSETPPYTVDYSLSIPERVQIVKEYYESTYEDPVTLFLTFKRDEIAPSYLSTGYKPLYDYFWVETE